MRANYGDFPLTHWHSTNITVMTTSTSWAGASTNRKYLLLVNDADIAIYAQLSTAYGSTAPVAVAQRGIRLNANGGSWESSRGLGNLYVGSIAFISTADTKNLLITEAW